MTDTKILEALAVYRKAMKNFDPERLTDLSTDPTHTGRWSHVRWMCDEAAVFVAQGRREKAMRWLGFIQGALWQTGAFTIEQLKGHVKPDGGDKGPVGPGEGKATCG